MTCRFLHVLKKKIEPRRAKLFFYPFVILIIINILSKKKTCVRLCLLHSWAFPH